MLLDQHRTENWTPESLFLEAVGPALVAYSQNEPVTTSDGKRVSASELLGDVQEEVVDFVLLQDLGRDGIA